MTKEGYFDGAEEEKIGGFSLRFKVRKLDKLNFNWRADIRRIPLDGGMSTLIGNWNVDSNCESEEDARARFALWKTETLKRIAG